MAPLPTLPFPTPSLDLDLLPPYLPTEKKEKGKGKFGKACPKSAWDGLAVSAAEVPPNP